MSKDITLDEHRKQISLLLRTDETNNQPTWLSRREDFLTCNMLKAWLANDNNNNTLQSAPVMSPVAS